MLIAWRNIPGKLYIEITVNENGIWDSHNDTELSMLAPYVKEHAELTIHFLCNGHYQPFSMYGGPDNLGHPEDGEEERLLDFVEVNSVKLPDKIAQQIFNLYESQIENVDVNYDYR